MTYPYRWQLAVYAEDLETTIPLAEYLELRREGRANWNPSLEDSTIILESQGREWLASTWNFGNLGIMVCQFEAALARLRREMSTIIRSAVDDYADVPYLMLEPVDATEVLISLFFIEDQEMRLVYPALTEPARVKALYDYVETNRTRLLGPVEPVLKNYTFRQLSFPYALLLDSLGREAQLGRELYALLGEEMPRV